MWEFGVALRRAKSICCLHLSGNPGIGKVNDEDDELVNEKEKDNELKEYLF
jgi:hypothetical protein